MYFQPQCELFIYLFILKSRSGFCFCSYTWTICLLLLISDILKLDVALKKKKNPSKECGCVLQHFCLKELSSTA